MCMIFCRFLGYICSCPCVDDVWMTMHWFCVKWLRRPAISSLVQYLSAWGGGFRFCFSTANFRSEARPCTSGDTIIRTNIDTFATFQSPFGYTLGTFLSPYGHRGHLRTAFSAPWGHFSPNVSTMALDWLNRLRFGSPLGSHFRSTKTKCTNMKIWSTMMPKRCLNGSKTEPRPLLKSVR